MRATVCRSCGAAVVWTLTEARKRMPVDLDPVADGNIRLVDDPSGPDILAFVVKSGAREFDDDGLRYKSHFATCPNAKSHRKGRS